MSITVDDIRDNIPYYLTQKAKDGLIKALNDFPDKMNYYTGMHGNELLQGDGWNCLDIIDFTTAKRKAIKGIILSNSCDINPENERDFPVKLVFAPIIPIKHYEHKLIGEGIDPTKVASKVSSIKQQKVTSMFYLPKGGALEHDYIALLGEIHTIPAENFINKAERKKQFTLGQAGFYVFLLKLSIHFCRFHEDILRDDPCVLA